MLKILIIGGTGIISTDVSHLAVERGFDVTLVNRGQRSEFIPKGARILQADARDEAQMKNALKGQYYDVVANFIGFLPEYVEQDIRLFSGKCGQYMYISSAAAYQKPSTDLYITESTPLKNSYWEYGRNKIACEEALVRAYRETDFPITIVRPSLTYNRTIIPFICNCWPQPWTLVDRIERGLPILVPGDGSSVFTITHSRDFAKGFVGLMGNPRAIGHPFHITSDEALTWNAYLMAIGDAVGKRPHPAYVSTQQICAIAPDMTGDLIGDKIQTAIFDNAKLKRFVPDYVATTPFALGIRESVAYLRANKALQVTSDSYNQLYDRIFESVGLPTGAID